MGRVNAQKDLGADLCALLQIDVKASWSDKVWVECIRAIPPKEYLMYEVEASSCAIVWALCLGLAVV